MNSQSNQDLPTYRWRQMTPEQRQETLNHRRQRGHPWHSPPHFVDESGLYMITAACYEHQPVIGESKERMAEFETDLVNVATEFCEEIFAWVVLPNHYHLLVHCTELKRFLK